MISATPREIPRSAGSYRFAQDFGARLERRANASSFARDDAINGFLRGLLQGIGAGGGDAFGGPGQFFLEAFVEPALEAILDG